MDIKPSHFFSVLSDLLNRGITPLHAACYGGHSTRIVQGLLAAGASVSQRCDAGRTALHYSVCSGNEDVLELLIEVSVGSDRSV